MLEQKTLMDETLEIETWNREPESDLNFSSPLSTTVEEVIGGSVEEAVQEEPVTEVLGSSSPGLEAMTEANSAPKLTRQFKCKEVFMAHSGIMMEREVFHVLPTSALGYPNPEEYALGVTYGEAKPQGRMMTGPNRKARRSAEKQKMKKINNKSK